MPEAISNTSPLLYLHRGGMLEWLAVLFGRVWVPKAVVLELERGRDEGFDVPDPNAYPWISVTEPRSIPSEWLAVDLGPGELATISLALENPSRILLLDDALARRIARSAGLEVWGTLRVLLEAKGRGLTGQVAPCLDRLVETGLWVSAEVRERILALAGER